MAVVAERATTSRSTLQKVEAGDASVSIGIYAAVLQAPGLADGLGEIADIGRESVHQALASPEIPKPHPPQAPIGAERPWLTSKSTSTSKSAHAR
jgi:hypothetical protein